MSNLIKIKNSRFTYGIVFGGILFSAIFYIYCVNTAVRNVVTREQAEEKILVLQNEVSDLEYRFATMENQMTLERAASLGLREPEQKIFIARDKSGKPLSINKP